MGSAVGVSAPVIAKPPFAGGGGRTGGSCGAGRTLCVAAEFGTDFDAAVAVHSQRYLSALTDLHLQSRFDGNWARAPVVRIKIDARWAWVPFGLARSGQPFCLGDLLRSTSPQFRDVCLFKRHP